MCRVLGSVLLAAVLASGPAACGDDAADGGRDEPTSSPSSTPAAPDHELIEMVTRTAADGEVGSAAALTDEAALAAFTAQFGDSMAEKLRTLYASTDVPEAMVAYAAVVAIGCDSPTDVTVARGADGLVVEAVEVPDPKQECLAPMTTVAFLLVSADAV